MTSGLVVLLVALGLALAAGMAWRLANGRMREPAAAAGSQAAASPAVAEPAVTGPAKLASAKPESAKPESAGTGLAGTGAPPEATAAAPTLAAQVPGPAVTSEQLGHALGERATLVQFSSAFCAPCRATRRILADVAGMTDGVAHIEIDAESRLDLVRQLNVLRTPTVLVLAADGRIARRASGQPRKADVIAALGAAVDQPPAVDQPATGESAVDQPAAGQPAVGQYAEEQQP